MSEFNLTFNGSQVASGDSKGGSTFRSGGQTKTYPQRPRITTSKPQKSAQPSSSSPKPEPRSGN